MPQASMKLSSQFQEGMRFECIEGCTKCCSIPGKVFFTTEDIPRMAAHFGITVEECKAKHLKRFWGGVYELNYPETKPCVFLGETGCLIYDARPAQCRTFPFWPDNLKSEEAWLHVVESCEGVGRGRCYTAEEIAAIAATLRNNPFI
jgi:uncharacterized protein